MLQRPLLLLTPMAGREISVHLGICRSSQAVVDGSIQSFFQGYPHFLSVVFQIFSFVVSGNGRVDDSIIRKVDPTGQMHFTCFVLAYLSSQLPNLSLAIFSSLGP
ncbi:hypothetical protein ILYODFUR_036596 [Ilyodon furcidens]|uniref:Uncharacterized protein n=1 Tax=Ilyodon furcidens TaxID=33524 RepID=A0ABV0SVQ3_9TELE